MINKINSSVSFSGYIPVKHFALNPKDNKYWRVTKEENLRKCQGFVVRNLNRTAKSMKNQEFVDSYKSQDRDYRNIPYVESVYDDKTPTIYMITGKDVDTVKNIAKPIGIAKKEAIDNTGKSKSPETKYLTKDYFRKVKAFLGRSCQQVKSPEGEDLELRVYFKPQYGKDGKVKQFIYEKSKFNIVDD